MLRLFIEDKKVYINMNKETVNELISRAKAMANTNELQALIANLEAFMAVPMQSEEGDKSRKNWEDAREKLWSSFEKLTALYGISPDFIKQQLDNSELFPSEYKETIGLIKEVSEEKPTKASLTKTLKARI